MSFWRRLLHALRGVLFVSGWGERKWFRRWCGGHWEKRWVHPVAASMWLQVATCCEKRPAESPPTECEEYRQGVLVAADARLKVKQLH